MPLTWSQRDVNVKERTGWDAGGSVLFVVGMQCSSLADKEFRKLSRDLRKQPIIAWLIPDAAEVITENGTPPWG